MRFLQITSCSFACAAYLAYNRGYKLCAVVLFSNFLSSYSLHAHKPQLSDNHLNIIETFRKDIYDCKGCFSERLRFLILVDNVNIFLWILSNALLLYRQRYRSEIVSPSIACGIITLYTDKRRLKCLPESFERLVYHALMHLSGCAGTVFLLA